VSFEYTDIEDEIAARLTTHIAATSSLTGKVEAVVIPDSEEDFKEPDEKDRITVYMFSVTAGKPITGNIRSYEELISITCNIMSRSLRGNDDFPGCHALAKVVKKVLTGFQPTHCGRLEWKSYQASNPPRDPEKKTWSYDVDFSCTKLFVQTLDDETDPDAPLLKEVILIDQFVTPE
jgi:hypothetical protein